MQDVKDEMIHQILADFLGTGDIKAATERIGILSTMHNQKVIGVVKTTTEEHALGPGRVMISSMDNEKGLYEEGRVTDLWKETGLAYSGPDQTLPKDMLYMDGGLYVNCSDDLFLGVYPGPQGKGPSITIGSEDEPGLLTLAFPSKENLVQIIDALQSVADTMESTPCSSSTDA